MNEILQYGALGILGVLILFIVPFLIKFLVDFIRELREESRKQTEGFTTVIENHLLHSQLETQEFIKCIDRLTETVDGVGEMVKKLNDMWENGK